MKNSKDIIKSTKQNADIIKSLERNNEKFNQKLNIFQVQQIDAGQLPSSERVVTNCVFKFLEKTQKNGLASKLARGYLLTDRKGQVLPVLNYDNSSDKYVVIALWISSPDILKPLHI